MYFAMSRKSVFRGLPENLKLGHRMNLIQTHQDNPAPGLISADFLFKNEDVLHTGQFITVAQPFVLTEAFKTSMTVRLPYFIFAIAINGLIREVSVTLAGASPVSVEARRVYRLPRASKPASKYVFEVEFVDWRITRLSINGTPLEELNGNANSMNHRQGSRVS